ncbi:hypothetical protein LCGC14_0337320 [marine sediment metagenome]|uniref:NUMOD4 domain-containing protein n=1 Tax=marine sediment metagenome TaxID=412755 RepID=A0A0F9TES2_9ZZZZ
METWKDIKGFEGLYQISDLGRVKSLTRKIVRRDGIALSIKERILKDHKDHYDSHGYLQVDLYKTGSRKTYKVARLVALAFIPNPENKRTVNHKKGNRGDNRAKKLEWATQAENMQHSYDVLGRKGPCLGKFGVDSPLSKPVLQFSKTGKRVAEYAGVSEAQRETGISHGNISMVCLGQRNFAGGFIWEFKKAS